MKRLFIIPILSLCLGLLYSGASIHDFIDPTGTYTLQGKVKNNRVMGHSGELRVQLLSSYRIAVAFYINKGYPNYESGSLIDTLDYVEDIARYTCDSSCTIIFRFYPRTMELMGLYSNPHSPCGFANGVMTPAVFAKTSWDRPVIQDLSAHGTVH